MKMRSPTRLTMTHMSPLSGSRSQPSLTVPAPRPNHSKLQYRCSAGAARAAWSAMQERTSEPAMAAIAAPAASRLPPLGVRAPTAAARSGSAGMVQRWLTAESIASALEVRRIRQADGLLVAVDRDHEGHAHRGLGGRHGDREEDEDDARGRRGGGAEAPERDEVQVRGVEHELEPQEDDDGVAARQGAREPDGEEQAREDQAQLQRAHGWSPGLSCASFAASTTAPRSADVRSTPTTRSAAPCWPMRSAPSWRTVVFGAGAAATARGDRVTAHRSTAATPAAASTARTARPRAASGGGSSRDWRVSSTAKSATIEMAPR